MQLLIIELRYLSQIYNRFALANRHLTHEYMLMEEYKGVESSLKEDFVSKKLAAAVSLHTNEMTTQPTFGSFQVASTQEDHFAAIARKLIWSEPDLFQGLYILREEARTASLTAPCYRGRPVDSHFHPCLSLVLNSRLFGVAPRMGLSKLPSRAIRLRLA